MIYIVSEALLYVCFAILTGVSVLALVPENKKPRYQVSDNALTWILLGIVILSSLQIIKLIIFYKVNLDYDLKYLTFTVLGDYNVGKAWFMTVIAAMAMLYLLGLKQSPKVMKYKWKIIPMLTVIQLVIFGYASHSASIYGWAGFASQTAHFMSAMVWIGVMIVIGWCTSEMRNWEAFLRWFTPMAIVCVIVTLGAGFLLMSRLSPDYVNSWITSYGQAMLIKHLLIVPIIALAFINSFLLRKKTSKTLSWLRVESIVVILLLAVTAFMGQQAPPHDDLKELLDESPPSNLFMWITGYDLKRGIDLNIAQNAFSISLATVALISLIFGLIWVWKNQKPFWSLAAVLLFVSCGYMSLMVAVG
ncbi:copper resistance D family protein [Paenibacillus alginolyticus]|uniref:CopD family protein n=1 Tax=Paenibacillus alginolyticus TaxID=59839 RepID=A0ABT4GIX9_9BACL|nr:CopD family protein [Paenibacillus alginolyticus]MCY9696158.1 CopD family protein [Paenibacillus alginolyticus]MEC0143311.1 CopD family protein [Paenibacillus alginolyticus]